mmetsp:Transcript_28719/g.85519  ORF Transcript_28719/g.85519 Transcript_28719/m.85519 type:complete len:220 (+) Transcript_28719:629-1288(+)
MSEAVGSSQALSADVAEVGLALAALGGAGHEVAPRVALADAPALRAPLPGPAAQRLQKPRVHARPLCLLAGVGNVVGLPATCAKPRAALRAGHCPPLSDEFLGHQELAARGAWAVHQLLPVLRSGDEAARLEVEQLLVQPGALWSPGEMQSDRLLRDRALAVQHRANKLIVTDLPAQDSTPKVGNQAVWAEGMIALQRGTPGTGQRLEADRATRRFGAS